MIDAKIIIYCFIITILTYSAIRYFITIAPKLGFVDIPNHRSSHKKVTPRGAGIVIALMFFISMFIFQAKLAFELIFPMLALLIIFICGIVDDIKGISSKVKFIFIIIASSILIYDGYTINYIGNYLGQDLNLAYFAIPFTVFAVVGFTNGLNLIDGLDGLAGGVAAVILTALLIVGIMNEDQILTVVPAFMLAIVAGFLLLNWNPAKVFMGDTGSLFLGFIISFLSIKALDYITPTSVLFLAAIPVLDTFVVFRRRMQRGKSPFSPDKNHMHHILYNMKRNIKFTVTTLIMMQASFSLIFLQVLSSNDILNIILFLLLYLIFFNLFDPRARRRHDKKKKKKKKDDTTYIELLKREQAKDDDE